MIFPIVQSTKYEDAECLLHRAQIINDVVAFNSTLNLGPKYQNWVDEHKELMNQLISMLVEDMNQFEKEEQENGCEAMAT